MKKLVLLLALFSISSCAKEHKKDSRPVVYFAEGTNVYHHSFECAKAWKTTDSSKVFMQLQSGCKDMYECCVCKKHV